MTGLPAGRPTRRLVVDDQGGTERRFVFEATFARTLPAALALLAEPWDELWLDHDLGDGIDTRPVADALVRLAEADRPRPACIVVHSMNPVGAMTLVAALESRYPVRRVRLSDWLVRS